jgi:hypothetical protein
LGPTAFSDISKTHYYYYYYHHHYPLPDSWGFLNFCAFKYLYPPLALTDDRKTEIIVLDQEETILTAIILNLLESFNFNKKKNAILDFYNMPLQLI